MKKVVRLRAQPEEAINLPQQRSSPQLSEQVTVRTTGRIKKPKAVFDPSDNYLPRSYRSGGTSGAAPSIATSSTTGFADRKRDSLNSNAVGHDSQRKRLSPISAGGAGSNVHLNELSTEVCYVCQKRGSNQKQKFIACMSCSRKVHRQCISIDVDNSEVLIQSFMCQKCRICCKCHESSKMELITCSKCLKSYHYQCHIPNVPLAHQQLKNWKCGLCLTSTRSIETTVAANLLGTAHMTARDIRQIIGGEPMDVLQASSKLENTITNHNVSNENVNGTFETITNGNAEDNAEQMLHYKKRKSQHFANEMEFEKSMNSGHHKSIDEDKSVENVILNSENCQMPDVKAWSVEDVAKFFMKDFPNEAQLLREHEIDGASLLLLKRSDIVKKLPLKLGPALRLYSLVLKLQTKSYDPTLGWNCDA